MENNNYNDLWPEYYDPVMRKNFLTKYEDVYAIRRYRGMEPDLTFFIDPENVNMKFTNEPFGKIYPDGELSWIEGKFWRDPEIGIPYFRPKMYRPEHVLVKVEWGGPNSSTRGLEWELFSKLAIYCKRGESKGRGEGINWYIFSTSFVYKDEETIAAIKAEYENQTPVDSIVVDD